MSKLSVFKQNVIVDYDNNILKFIDDTEEPKDFYLRSFELNPDGYITSLTTLSSGYPDTDFYYDRGHTNLEYDSQGHLLKVDISNDEGHSSQILSWEDGLLKKFQSGYLTLEFSYGKTSSHGMWSSNMLEDIELEIESCTGCSFPYLFYTGLFGKAPSLLPNEMRITYNSQDYLDSFNLKISYEFNKNGTIDKEIAKDDGWESEEDNIVHRFYYYD